MTVRSDVGAGLHRDDEALDGIFKLRVEVLMGAEARGGGGFGGEGGEVLGGE